MADKRVVEHTSGREYIQKKDLFYIIVFLALALILVFSWRAGGISILVNQISLVGSVSSILLALIAIGYAFFQANNSSWENRQMLETLGRVNKKVEELGDIKDEMLIIKDELSTLRESSNDGMSNVMAAISDLPDKLNFDGVLEILKEQGITISSEAAISLKEKYQEKLNSEVNKLKKKVIRLDTHLEAEIANYLTHEKQHNDLIKRLEIKAHLNKKGFELTNRDVALVLRKFAKAGIVRMERTENNSGKSIIKFYKDGELEFYENNE